MQGNIALFASFIDGSKTNEECAMIANATGLSPDVRGMHGPEVSFAEFPTRVPQLLDAKKNGGILHQTGVAERMLPAAGPDAQPVWCFVVVRAVNELQRVYMSDMAVSVLPDASIKPGSYGTEATFRSASLTAPGFSETSTRENTCAGTTSLCVTTER